MTGSREAPIDRGVATQMRGAAGLRNRIVHGYALFDHDRLHAEAGDGVVAVRVYLAAVVNALG